MYGAGYPFGLEDLPRGPLRSGLEGLPPQARARGLNWLHGFAFPGADAASLRVDRQGGVFYECPGLDSLAEQDERAGTGETPIEQSGLAETQAPIDLGKVFKLHSKPGATRVVYLNMTGHTVTGTVWNASSGFSTLDMLPYSQDNDYATFTPSELNAIAETWKRIAEDYAPYAIDVTTEKPASFGPNVGHLLVTRKADRNGNSIYTCSCGGVAYVNVWGASNYTYYQPALVFTDGVGTGPHNIAEAASHEFGHNLSLSHDGTSTVGYYSGHGSGYTDWAPIMGVGYNGHVTQWSKGEYADANNPQDDLQLIADRLTYRTDDHKNTDFAAATPLVVTNNGTEVYATTPVLDPDNTEPGNKGIIENRADVDLFSVDVGAGIIDLTVTPVWLDVFTTQSYRGANLDLKATLYDANGGQIAANPAADTYARINASVAAGHYILAIEGVGVGDPLTTGYTDYASLGQYFINGTVPAAGADTTPPPIPELSITSVGSTTIAMQANPITDDRGGTVQYQFHCVASGQGCSDSSWQTSTSYTATGLAPNTGYSFQVRASDPSGNASGYSAAGFATTATANLAPTASYTWTASGLTVHFTDASTDSDGSVAAWSWNFGDDSTSSSRNPSKIYAAPGTYIVTLTVTDNQDATNAVSQSVPVTAPSAHIGNLDNASTKSGTKWNARVTITVHDGNDGVPGASVSGSWSAGSTGTASCTTDTNGQCTVAKSNLKTSVSSVKFSVTNVIKSGYSYNSTANHDPGTDSNGTVITVNRP